MTLCDHAHNIPETTLNQPEPSHRLLGLDVARSLAIAGMIVVHFCTTMAHGSSESSAGMSLIGTCDWLLTWFLAQIDGRPAGLFMILAGMGVTLMTRTVVTSGDAAAITAKRRMLVYRGLILLILGYLNLTIWVGDILRVYGVSMFVAAALITASNRTLWLCSLGFVIGFIIAFALLDYSGHWDWELMAYDNQWTPDGIVRNLFYNGFRSVLPWTGLMCFGMWLGRLNLRDKAVNKRMWIIALSMLIVVHATSSALVGMLAQLSATVDYETIYALVGTASMPPLPLFLLSTGSSAVLIVALCVRFVGDRPNFFVRAFADTGQMALTWYVAHIVIGLGTVEQLGLIGSTTHTFAAICGLAYFCAALIASYFWKRRFRYGPLEWAMRKIAG